MKEKKEKKKRQKMFFFFFDEFPFFFFFVVWFVVNGYFGVGVCACVVFIFAPSFFFFLNLDFFS